MRWILSIVALVSVAAIADQVQIEKAITGINPIIQIESVKPVDDTPFFEVTLKTGERIYTDANGSHFVAGDLYRVGIGGLKNLTDIGRRADRQELLAQLDESKLVVGVATASCGESSSASCAAAQGVAVGQRALAVAQIELHRPCVSVGRAIEQAQEDVKSEAKFAITSATKNYEMVKDFLLPEAALMDDKRQTRAMEFKMANGDIAMINGVRYLALCP